MTSKLDIYKAYYNAAWTNPPASLAQAEKTYFSDTFQSLDKDGKVVMDRKTYDKMSQLLFTAFKDFKWTQESIREDNDGVIATGHFEGIHSGNLDLSAMGLGIIPPSGKKIVWPQSTVKFLITGDKIIGEKNLSDPNPMATFLTPLGVAVPVK